MMQNSNYKNQWPSSLQIFWLQLTFGIWNLLTFIFALWSIQIIATTVIGLGNGLDIDGQNQIWALTILLLIVCLYWQERLKGKKPSAKNNLPFLTYCNPAVRKLIWGGLRRFYASVDEAFLAKHLISELIKQPGVKISLIRLGVTKENLLVLGSANEDIKTIFSAAFAYALAENVQIDWSHLFKAVIANTATFKLWLAGRKISEAEALAVVDWTRREFGFTPVKLRSGLLHDLLSPKRNMNKSWTARPTPVLDKFSQDLTDLAKLGFLTSAKVRTKEVEDAIQALSRSESNNVILVGEAGVGKTSIVGDIALRLIRGDIPSLSDHKLISLNVGAMLGSGINLQQLFAQAVNEASISGNIILFVGSLDQFGKSKSSEGFDFSMILQNALENKLQLIGTSDPMNYKKYIESNSNLVQMFTRVNVDELDFGANVLVLEDISYKIENKQKVLITLGAIKSAVELAQRYVHLGKLPDTAIDLLDEAAVYASRHGKKLVEKGEVELIMSSKTNVPVGEINVEEKTKLVGLEEKIHGRLIGQEEAVKAVVEALKRSRLGVTAEGKRPIGTFLFLGPTGVGKTELAKSLAWSYFGSEEKMIRLDMGEYQTKESVYRLLGAPAISGDIALSGSAFLEAVKKTPFAVVLLDEIEKAHKEVLDIFLRVLDEGKITDNLGNTVDFTHTIIIATSNAQARMVQEAVRSGMAYSEMQKQLTNLLIQESFRPEFINRFDGVIVFKPLAETEIEQIAKLKIEKMQKHLKENRGINLIIGEGVVAELAKQGYDPAFGARPLERVIREKIENKIANELLKSDTKEVQINLEDLK